MATNTLTSLFQAHEFVAAPGVFDLVSAKLADRTKAKALYMTGIATVASYLGYAEAGLATYTDMLNRVTSIAQSVSKPRSSKDFLILARTAARTVVGLDEAIRRAEASVKAGADAIFIETPESVEEMEKIGRASIGAQLVSNQLHGGKTPILPQA
jgi:2,3-dimethylmalate lyase